MHLSSASLLLFLSSVTGTDAFSSLQMTSTPPVVGIDAKHALFDMPVSNNGARCRIILYKKEIPPQEVMVTPPSALGGLKSDDYLAVNPQGKMPALTCPDTGLNLAESDTIARYLLTRYANQGPDFQPENPKSNLLCRIHDMYLTTIQGCLYRPPPFGTFGTRKDALAEFVKQLSVIENLIEPGPYLLGDQVSLADATIFPTMVFAAHMLPKFDITPPLPPKLDQWFHSVRQNDAAFGKVFDEIMGGLQAWEERNRWDPILGAGWRDTAPATIFDKIVAGEIPASIVKQDDKILAFKDVNPVAPAHVLIIPKDRNGLTRLSAATAEHAEILGHLMVAAGEVARDTSLGFGDGARIVINDGPDGGQEVMHLHVHVLGGRPMQWPPG